MLDERLHIRQTGIIDPAKLTHKISIIGAGSIGGWTTLCLGKLGCQNINVYDFDEVEIHNAGSQVYTSSDEGSSKVEALQERMKFLLEQPIQGEKIKWTPETNILKDSDIVIAAVDSITPRAQMFKWLEGTDKLYIDARMAANAIEIYTVKCNDKKNCEYYSKTLFPESETLPVACSERSVVYNVFVVAGLIGDLVAKYANGQELPKELITDLYNFTLFQ